MDPAPKALRILVTSFGDARAPYRPVRRREDLGYLAGCRAGAGRRPPRSVLDLQPGGRPSRASMARVRREPSALAETATDRRAARQSCACAISRTTGARNAGALQTGWNRRLRAGPLSTSRRHGLRGARRSGLAAGSATPTARRVRTSDHRRAPKL